MVDAYNNNVIRRKKEETSPPPPQRHSGDNNNNNNGSNNNINSNNNGTNNNTPPTGRRRNLSLMTLLLTASAIVTLITSIINLHLLSVVMMQQENGVLHELVASAAAVSLSSSSSSSSNTNNNEEENNEPQSGFRDDGTYWTNDINDPSYIDVQKEEVAIQNPILADGNTTFGACLLVMDDNHRLVEWLAYHYHVLPLRFLIITIDPRSRTSPTHVLNRWRQMGMYIVEWNDFDFLKPNLAKHPVPDDARLEDKRARHRIRQRQFFRKCLQVSKEQYHRSYVALIDTDEYIMYNHKGGTPQVFEEWESTQLQLHNTNKETKRKTRIRPASVPPSPYEEGGMMKYIRREEAAGTPFFQGPCLSAPRLQIGAIERNDTNIANGTGVSEFPDMTQIYKDTVNSDRFETLRFHRHGPRQEFVNNRLAKCIIDVTRVEEFPEMDTLHRPIKTICPPPWRNEWDSGLRIYHYLGTWEAYTFRDDARRGGEHSKELWYFKSAAFADETDDNITPWMDGFLQTHGHDKAKELLRGAGLPRGFVNPIGHNFTYDYRHLHQIMNETARNSDPTKKEMQLAFDKFVLEMHNKDGGDGNK